MILTVDINNTGVVFAVMDEGRALHMTRLSSDRNKTSDEYAILIDLAFRQRGFDVKCVEGAIISSVVPPLTAVVKEAVSRATGHSPMIIGPGIKTGLNIRLEDPTELGGDFVASAVAAIAAYPLPCEYNDSIKPFGSSVLYYDGVSIHCMSSQGAVRWSFQLGSGAGFDCTDDVVAAWAGNSTPQKKDKTMRAGECMARE